MKTKINCFLVILSAIMVSHSCIKDDDSTDTNNLNRIVINDTTSQDILFTNFNPDLEFGDSVNIYENSTSYLAFSIKGLDSYETCMEDCNSHPGEICDCDHEYSYNFLLKTDENIELSYDSVSSSYPRVYSNAETISEEDTWIKKDKHILFYTELTYYLPHLVNNSDNYIGFRYLQETDTMYGWIDIYFQFQSKYEIKSMGIQKNKI